MNRARYRYTFASTVDFADVKLTLQLALLAAESIFGGTRLQLDGRYWIDDAARSVTIDGDSEVGKRLNELFAGFLTREFGLNVLDVEHVSAAAQTGATS